MANRFTNGRPKIDILDFQRYSGYSLQVTWANLLQAVDVKLFSISHQKPSTERVHPLAVADISRSALLL